MQEGMTLLELHVAIRKLLETQEPDLVVYMSDRYNYETKIRPVHEIEVLDFGISQRRYIKLS